MMKNHISQTTSYGKVFKTLPNKEALYLIEESISRGENVKIKVRGNSMAPLLINNLDFVTLHPLGGQKIAIADIIFFRYKGSFLMHRAVELDGDSDCAAGSRIVARGDAINTCEIIKYEDIIAKVSLPARYSKWWYLCLKRILWRLIKIYIFARGVF